MGTQYWVQALHLQYPGGGTAKETCKIILCTKYIAHIIMCKYNVLEVQKGTP